jgi:hypothetical protein
MAEAVARPPLTSHMGVGALRTIRAARVPSVSAGQTP